MLDSILFWILVFLVGIVMVPWWDFIIWANLYSQMMALLEFLYCDLILWCGNFVGTMACFYDVRSYNMAALRSFFYFSNFLGCCCCSFIFSFLIFFISAYGIWWSANVIKFFEFYRPWCLNDNELNNLILNLLYHFFFYFIGWAGCYSLMITWYYPTNWCECS